MFSHFQQDRRAVLKSLAGTAAASACGSAFGGEPGSHGSLPAWTVGHFDMHHIDTGRGNATLLIFPDGTTMMIDAGAAGQATPGTLAPAHPDDSRSPGEWQARYVLAHAPGKRLDYFLATHIHPDHVSGLADVQAAVPIHTCIDRSFPHYRPSQQPAEASFANQYLALLRRRTQAAQPVETAQVGSVEQITLERQPGSFPDFRAVILAANGDVWNPGTHAVESRLRDLPAKSGIQGNENLFSVAVRFTYGNFSYFSGGDLTFDTHDGREALLDMESPVVRAAGRTEVAVADHHGYFDACGPNFTNVLDAQAYIIPSWEIGHPGTAQMQRMLGAWGNGATRDVFTLDLLPANALLNRRFASQLRSQGGHVVVRVAPGGSTFKIFVLDATVENGSITGVFGPYTSRA